MEACFPLVSSPWGHQSAEVRKPTGGRAEFGDKWPNLGSVDILSDRRQVPAPLWVSVIRNLKWPQPGGAPSWLLLPCKADGWEEIWQTLDSRGLVSQLKHHPPHPCPSPEGQAVPKSVNQPLLSTHSHQATGLTRVQMFSLLCVPFHFIRIPGTFTWGSGLG